MSLALVELLTRAPASYAGRVQLHGTGTGARRPDASRNARPCRRWAGGRGQELQHPHMGAQLDLLYRGYQHVCVTIEG